MTRPVKDLPVYEQLTYTIIGLAMTIHRSLGPIHKELVYQRALAKELSDNNIPFQQEASIPVSYKDKNVGVYKPDFVVHDKIIIELKAQPFLPLTASTQLTYYLKATGYRVGLLLNFGAGSLQVKRRIYGY